MSDRFSCVDPYENTLPAPHVTFPSWPTTVCVWDPQVFLNNVQYGGGRAAQRQRVRVM